MLGLNMQVPHRQPPPRYTPPSPQKMGTQQLQQSPYWGHEPSDNGTVVVYFTLYEFKIASEIVKK